MASGTHEARCCCERLLFCTGNCKALGYICALGESVRFGWRNQNAKNRIPALKDDAFEFSRIDVMGFPVLKLIHREHTDRVNLFLIVGDGMFHCYPVFPIVKETKEGWNLMVRLMKGETSNAI